jgi:NAD(P)-dependent dehydrogenase (short-subunit alcohol dehydrogenase family)
MSRLAGKTVLVCGATGALGSACATAVAAEGATVVLAGKNVKLLEKRFDALVAAGSAEPAIYPINFEGAHGKDYVELAERVEAELGGIDALVWAVGHWHGLEALNNLEPAQWLRSLHVNATAPWLLFQACFASLRARQGVALFPLQSQALIEQAFCGAYGAAHAALRNWVSSAASENERLLPRVLGVELPPLKSKLRLAAFPAESAAELFDASALAPRLIELLLSGAPGLHRLGLNNAAESASKAQDMLH